MTSACRGPTSIGLVLLASAGTAWANPVVINPPSFIAFWVVVFFASVVESGIAALVVTFSGVSPIPIFFGFLIGNAAIYFVGFRPLLEHESLPLPLLECAVVAGDGVLMKILSQFDTFQGDRFVRLSWLRAGISAVAGNAFSYIIGVMASNPS